VNNEFIGQLLGFIMAHSASIGDELKEGELLVPYVITNSLEGERELFNFESDTQENAVMTAKEKLAEFSKTEFSWSYSQDGFITLENGERQDVFLFNIWAKGMNEPLEAYQLYSSSPFKLIGNIQVLNFEDTGLDTKNTEAFIKGLDEGISFHPTGSKKWDSWFE